MSATELLNYPPPAHAPYSSHASRPHSINNDPIAVSNIRNSKDVSLDRIPTLGENESPSDAISTSPPMSRIVVTVLQPALANFLSSFTNGVITVGLPVIARSITLQRSLYLWPSSVYGLTSGSMLLIAGSIADLAGPRNVELLGILLLGIFTLACGFSATGVQLVIFRALQGVAMAMHLPSSVALVAAGVPSGRARNIGFGCLGLSQPLGFSVGLVVSGILIERMGWRSGFYIAGAAILVAGVAAMWMLPSVKPDRHGKPLKKAFWSEIDWIGGTLASGGLAILAYVLAVLSADLTSIRSAQTATLLSLSLALIVAFPFWMYRQEKAGRPALIPNSLWKALPFTSTCIMVILANGMMNSMELFSSLYFQEVQNKSVLTTSLYLLPSLLVGVCINLSVGIFVDRVPTRWLVVGSSLLCAVSPVMMAVVDPKWNYWYLEFWAQLLSPLSIDVLFTVGLIIVSDSFPEKTQALAGAVFNTVAQFGQSLGMGVCQVAALGVMGKDQSSGGGHGGGGESFDSVDAQALLNGYRASFWTMFAYMAVCGVIAMVGLRKTDKIGLKRE